MSPLVTEYTQRPTIRDVALLAGVSKSLVSLVYSTPNAVSIERKERVLEAAAKLGFAPNFLARSLAANSGTFIGILVADLHNPLFAEIVDYVRVELEEKGESGFMTSAMLQGSDGNQIIDKQTIRALIDLRPKSVLVVGSIPSMNNLRLLPDSVPIVVASAIAEGIDRASTVRVDDEKGMSLVIDHLISKGHSNIAHITVGNGLVSQSRQSAYVKAMKKNGLKKFVQIVKLKTEGERESYLRTQELIKGSNAPTAITAFNDLSALGAQQAIGKADIALVGYDNTFLANLEQISLTSVDPGNKEIAKKAAELLTLKESSSLKIGKSYLLEPKLVIRRSSEKKVKRDA